jgi:hypothetical protein
MCRRVGGPPSILTGFDLWVPRMASSSGNPTVARRVESLTLVRVFVAHLERRAVVGVPQAKGIVLAALEAAVGGKHALGCHSRRRLAVTRNLQGRTH